MDIQKIKINLLIPATYNPRKDLKPDDEEYKKIKRSIENFGYVCPLIVNKDYTVIGGHQRLKVLQELGYNEVECVVVDLDKTKEKALNIALNKISGDWDIEKLDALLKELKDSDFDMDLTGYSFDEIDDMIGDMIGSKDDNFDLETALNEIDEPVTKLGDIYQLGKHRLICGDATDDNTVKKLMNGTYADLVITDPPYNVDYEGTAGKIKNDNMSEDKFYKFLLLAFENLYNSLKAGGGIYVFHADTEGLNFRTAFKEAGFKLAECLIWEKDRFVLGRQDYQWQHEPILYGWKEGSAHYFVDKRTLTTILQFERPKNSDLHPTMKPIDLLSFLLKNSSKENEIILDLFGGSGSTLIAAEQTKRICYMSELDPKYCDVIVKRWEDLTNQEAVLINK